jgi:hypothetical protein
MRSITDGRRAEQIFFDLVIDAGATRSGVISSLSLSFSFSFVRNGQGERGKIPAGDTTSGCTPIDAASIDAAITFKHHAT